MEAEEKLDEMVRRFNAFSARAHEARRVDRDNLVYYFSRFLDCLESPIDVACPFCPDGKCYAPWAGGIVADAFSHYTPAGMDIRPLMTLWPHPERI